MVNPSSIWKLRFTMVGTLALIISISTLAFAAILTWFEAFDLYTLAGLVLVFNILQWLLGPYLVNMMYGVKKLDSNVNPTLHQIVENLSLKSGIKTPQLMISSLNIPNAFAYGSPLTGNHVAVTQGLLNELDTEEVEAVIGHEIGHLTHRDTQVMMVVSFLPSLFYILARSMIWSSYSRDRKNNGSGLAIIGAISMGVYFLLTLFNLSLSRQREYYADQHASSIVDDGARKLSEGLAKISTGIWKHQMYGEKINASSFKTLFITDPDRAAQDVTELNNARYTATDSQLVEEIINHRVSGFENFFEIFSTHPNIVKRLKALNS
ncbi:M48 family metalloprotease [Candidatus Bathyarchaeota archaeon]|nr:M48 family metalloprotease [Candidatus Bathyarchaeota archaeon]